MSRSEQEEGRAVIRLDVGLTLQSLDDPGGDARAVEEAGFRFCGVGEHLAFHVPMANGFISLAAAAGATSSIELMSAVTLAPLYPPALLAKLGAALAVASGERFHLGVGVGGENPIEFDACGVPVTERGARTDEALDIVRRLWAGSDVDFEGRFNRFSGVTIDPRPSSPPPIWVSGRSEAAMRRAAVFGDGWLPYMFTPERFAESVATVARHRPDDRPVRAGLFAWACVHEDGDQAREWVGQSLSQTYNQDFTPLVDRYALAGTPDEVVARIGEFADAGMERLLCAFGCPPTALARTRALFTSDVLPVVQR